MFSYTRSLMTFRSHSAISFTKIGTDLANGPVRRIEACCNVWDVQRGLSGDIFVEFFL